MVGRETTEVVMGRPRGSKYFDMVNTGDVFGGWTVTGTPFMDKSQAKVECKCECGIQNPVRIDRLINGKTTQCRKCGIGSTQTLRSFSNKSHLYSARAGQEYRLNESNFSESFSLQSNSCALTAEAISVSNAAPVAYDGSKGLTPDNTILVSQTISEQMGSMDAKTFIGLCQTVANNAIPPAETKKRNVSIKDFFDKREQQ